MTKTKEIQIWRIIPLVALPLLAWIFGRALDEWSRMWIMAFTLYAGCKYFTLQDLPAEGDRGAECLYLLAWPGMNPQRFLRPGFQFTRESGLVKRGIRNVLIGVILMAGLAPLWAEPHPLFATWLAMTGMIFLLHFGLFHFLAAFWQKQGFGAESIMNRPLEAQRVAELWGFRWNRAFQILMFRYVFTPLRKRIKPVPALWISFLLSGLIHEAVITVPAGGGYGGPTLYFLLQALAVMIERKIPILKKAWIGWLWTMGAVLIPAGLLFPKVFVLRVMYPLFADIGIFPALEMP